MAVFYKSDSVAAAVADLLTLPRPVDTIVMVGGVMYRSTNATTATYVIVGSGGVGTQQYWDREIPVTGQGGVTRTTDMRPRSNITVNALYLYALTAPTTAGAYTFAAAGAGNNLLTAATFNLTTLVDNTYTAMVLTATTANLNIAANALIRFTFASNLNDLAGSGILLVMHYTMR